LILSFPAVAARLPFAVREMFRFRTSGEIHVLFLRRSTWDAIPDGCSVRRKQFKWG